MTPQQIIEHTLQLSDRDMMIEITRLDNVNRAVNIIDQMIAGYNGVDFDVYTPEGQQIMNGLLEAYRPETGPLSTIALLRSTYVARRELSNWNSCMDRSYRYSLATEGEATTLRRFRGLH